jgi:hypothetical protein
MRNAWLGLVIAVSCLQVSWSIADETPCQSIAYRPAGCDIKGIITTDNEQFYVLPNDPRHATFCLDLPQERWLCSVDEAWNLGWRMPLPKAQPPPRSHCRIKGNVGEDGKIYHVPKSTYYDRTLIDPERGDRWFCTEQEAMSQGFRAPLR